MSAAKPVGVVVHRHLAIALLALVVSSPEAKAAYTAARSAPVSISQVVANEYGAPFVYFTSLINQACENTTGLYLYDITNTQPNVQYQNAKLAVLLSAQAQGKQVILDFFYDPTVSSFAACYIEGVTIVN